MWQEKRLKYPEVHYGSELSEAFRGQRLAGALRLYYTVSILGPIRVSEDFYKNDYSNDL
jgi:hypothetical protein